MKRKAEHFHPLKYRPGLSGQTSPVDAHLITSVNTTFALPLRDWLINLSLYDTRCAVVH